MSKITNNGFIRSGWHTMLHSCTQLVTVGVKALNLENGRWRSLLYLVIECPSKRRRRPRCLLLRVRCRRRRCCAYFGYQYSRTVSNPSSSNSESSSSTRLTGWRRVGEGNRLDRRNG